MNDSDKTLALLTKVPNVIEREALLATLIAAGVEAVSPDRSMIVNFANEQNLSLEGYSSFFDGYEIRVPDSSMPVARGVLDDFRRRAQVAAVDDEPLDPQDAERAAFRRFLACAMWGLILPLVMNVVSLWWLVKAWPMARRRPWALAVGLGLNLMTFSLGGFLGRSVFLPAIFSS